jgi:hypothetical protein
MHGQHLVQETTQESQPCHEQTQTILIRHACLEIRIVEVRRTENQKEREIGSK